MYAYIHNFIFFIYISHNNRNNLIKTAFSLCYCKYIILLFEKTSYEEFICPILYKLSSLAVTNFLQTTIMFFNQSLYAFIYFVHVFNFLVPVREG